MKEPKLRPSFVVATVKHLVLTNTIRHISEAGERASQYFSLNNVGIIGKTMEYGRNIMKYSLKSIGF
jgi:hypothetical protein